MKRQIWYLIRIAHCFSYVSALYRRSLPFLDSVKAL